MNKILERCKAYYEVTRGACLVYSDEERYMLGVPFLSDVLPNRKINILSDGNSLYLSCTVAEIPAEIYAEGLWLCSKMNNENSYCIAQLIQTSDSYYDLCLVRIDYGINIENCLEICSSGTAVIEDEANKYAHIIKEILA